MGTGVNGAEGPSCKENIKVFVRIRPPLHREQGTQSVTQVGEDGKEVKIDTDAHNVLAKFDRVFDENTGQFDVYEEVKFAAESVAQGLNSTIFAYGQTGSGKSYTMFGPEDDLSIYGTGPASKSMGVIPRAIRAILHHAEMIRKTSKGKEEEEVSLYCSFMQIYNDQPYDLLRDPMRIRPLGVHENTKTKEIYVSGLSEYAIHSLQDCLALLEQGDEQRACRQTQMNDVSSRSHSIFQLIVERRQVHTGRQIRSKLNLVDLAGSEKWGILDSLDQSHVSELTNINTSLHTLGRCIAALTDPDTTHVPFRDSKLTRILQDALGGNSRTCLIATLSPSATYIEETISTLKFADRAKRVMQHAHVVETRQVSIELVERLEREIVHLRSLLKSVGVNPSTESGQPEVDDDEEESASEKRAFLDLEKDLFEANERIRKLEQENTRLVRGGGDGKPSQEDAVKPTEQPTVAPAPAPSKDLEGENEKLRYTLSNVRTCATRFFKFEIEEEEFQTHFNRYINAMSESLGADILHSPSSGTSGRKLVAQSKLQETAFRGMNCGNPTVPDGGIKSNAMFRVRGRKDSDPGKWNVNNSETKVKSLSSSLKEKQKELEKHKKLQQWVAEKAQRELEKLEREKDRDEQSTRDKRKKNEKFKKHAGIVKQKLTKIKQEEKRLYETEQKQNNNPGSFPKINLSRPESRNSLLDNDIRPLSRQTIYEEND